MALVTGASSGIGRAIARKLAKCGVITVAAARRLDLLTELQNELKAENGSVTLVPMRMDVTNRDEVCTSERERTLVELFVKLFSPLRVVHVH